MREHSDIVLPSGKTAKLKKELNAGEHEMVELSIQRNFQMTMENGSKEPTILPVGADDIQRNRRHTLIEAIVLEYDGKAENILTDVLAGTRADYDMLILEAEKVAQFMDPTEPEQGNRGKPTSADKKLN